jgi:serine phosphatase RsbU (regulator of sigma subunit)/PAS domain-containing protein
VPVREWTRSDRWLAGALALAGLIAVVDLVQDRAVVIALLAVPPIVASVRCGMVRTALVGVVSVVLAILLGGPDDIGSRAHAIDVSAVAAVAFAAIYVARVRERLETAEHHSRLLAQAGAVVQRSLDYENSLMEIARLAVPDLCDWCAIVVKKPSGSLQQVAAIHVDMDREDVVAAVPLEPDRGAEYANALRGLGLRSTIVEPLTARGRTLGAIAFATMERELGPDERALASGLAERAAGALDNAQLYLRLSAIQADLASSRDQLEAILDGVADGVTAQDASGKMVYANETALRLLGFPSVAAIQAVPIRYVLSRFDAYDETGRPFPLERLPGRQALRGERPDDVLVRMRRRDTLEERWQVLKATPILDEEGRVVLAINVYEDVTEQIKRERTQRVMARASELLSTSLDYERTLAKIAEIAAPEIGDWCAVDVRVDGEIVRLGFVGPDPESTAVVDAARKRVRLDPAGPAGIPRVLRTGEPELYPNVDDASSALFSDEQRDLVRVYGIRSVMYVPLNAQGRTLGVITLLSGAASGRVFDVGDLGLAQQLADRCAVAIDNARLFRERSRIARTLQESLLPPVLPELPGIDVGARFHPAGEGYEVGGDFYDVFDVGGGSFGVVIGDVQGKGPDAAAVTALARYTVRATAMHDRSPAGVLRSLNEAMLSQGGERRFCTVGYARIDPTTIGARVTVASGGHPLPLVLRAHGESREAGVPGTLLGVVPDPEILDSTVDLEPGDAIVLYTDGVTEARAPKRVFGEVDLAGVAVDHERLRAAAIAERIERGALSVGSGEQRDDIAIVVLKVRAAGVAAPPEARIEGVPAV